MHWCQHTWFGLQPQPGWDPGKSLFVSPRLFTSCSGKSSYEGAFLRLLRFCHAMPCQATSYETAIQDLYKFWYAKQIPLSTRTVSSPCSCSDAHVIALLPLYGLWHLGPHMGAFLTQHGHWLSDWLAMAHHSCSALPNSVWTKIIKSKGGMEGRGKNPLLSFWTLRKSLLLLSHPKPQRRGCLF